MYYFSGLAVGFFVVGSFWLSYLGVIGSIYRESVGHLHITHIPSSEFANLDYIVCESIAAM